MERHRFATGEQVFDWTIPREWTIRDGVDQGSRRDASWCSLADSNLHVVVLQRARARSGCRSTSSQAHLHSLPDQPDAIPYRTSYYDEAGASA